MRLRVYANGITVIKNDWNNWNNSVVTTLHMCGILHACHSDFHMGKVTSIQGPLCLPNMANLPHNQFTVHVPWSKYVRKYHIGSNFRGMKLLRKAQKQDFCIYLFARPINYTVHTYCSLRI